MTQPLNPSWSSLDRGTADWFGVSKDSDSTQRWRRKSLQHCSHLYGGLKAQVMREMELHSQDNLSLASTETPPPLYLPPHHPSNHHYGMQRVGQRLGLVAGIEE
ncbi:inactive rhomboid protein 1-like isoform X3 [Lates japonicus]